jgi:hypothetical protein
VLFKACKSSATAPLSSMFDHWQACLSRKKAMRAGTKKTLSLLKLLIKTAVSNHVVEVSL